MEVVVDVTELKQRDLKEPQSLTIQLGAFKNIDDAESLKAQIAFIGHTAYIQGIIDKKQTEWHRVRIGPFDSAREAGVIVKNLEDNGFDSITIKEK
jgi:cell division protein FtsN